MDMVSYLLGKNSSVDGNNAFIDTASHYYSDLGIAANIKSIDYIDTSNLTTAQSMFINWINLKTIPLLDTSNCTSFYSMFYNCQTLQSVPLLNTSRGTNFASMFGSCFRLKEIPQFDTSNAQNFKGFISGCTDLTTVPLLNTSKATNFDSFISQATSNLTDNSLDNILQMLINAISYTGTKTLYRAGFRSDVYSSARIQALPHYQDFLDAGWTIGY